jgi:hypothetical protein
VNGSSLYADVPGFKSPSIITGDAYRPTAFAYMKQLNRTAYNFSISLILIPFCIILNFLNKKESKVICKREFEIILLQTQSLSIKPYLVKGSLVL